MLNFRIGICLPILFCVVTQIGRSSYRLSVQLYLYVVWVRASFMRHNLVRAEDWR